MFFFGPLSTHLPYIILGLVYVISVSVVSLKAVATQEENSQHFLRIYQDEEETNLSVVTLFYDDFSEGASVSYAEIPVDNDISIAVWLLPPKPKLQCTVLSTPYNFIGFGRPPPVS
jgi:hypothetical protein